MLSHSPYIFRLTPRRLFAALFALLLVLSPTLEAVGCAPEFPVAVLVSTSHPDLPLKRFAAGNIGVIKTSWAKSYLCVSYRYLTNNPLDAQEQRSILRLWHHRLKDAMQFNNAQVNEIEAYITLRQKVLGLKQKQFPEIYSAVDSYRYKQDIFPDSFKKARLTLMNRIQKYGIGSAQVREWLKRQDVVFGLGSAKTLSDSLSPALASDALLQADRKYQTAATTLYKHDYLKAADLFAEIGADKNSPWNSSAPYLIARSRTNAVLANSPQADFDATTAYVRGLLDKNNAIEVREDLYDLLRPLKYRDMSRQEIVDFLVASVMKSHTDRFGGDVGDLTFTIDNDPPSTTASSSDGSQTTSADTTSTQSRVEVSKHDLTDWLKTIQHADDDYRFYEADEKKKFVEEQNKRAAHALARWRERHTVQWLVAAISLNGLRPPDTKDLYTAASLIPKDSPAYLTAQFFLVDAQIGGGQLADARARVLPILSRNDLTPSDRNLFQGQLVASASSLSEYLRSTFMTAPVICSNYCALPDKFMAVEGQNHYYKEVPVLDKPVADDLNRNLPLSMWFKISNDRTLDPKFRARLVRSTWVRAQLLNRPEIVNVLTPQLSDVYPVLSMGVKQYSAAPAGDSKRFAMASLVLRNVGMTPYVESGVERHGEAINEFDYYNSNYWLPLRVSGKNPDDDLNYYNTVVMPGSNILLNLMYGYYKSGVKRFLSLAQRKEADTEAEQIWKNHPSKFLGDAVFARMNTNPQDPQIPELLYKINRLPKWSGLTPVGSQYSKKAYGAVHTRYPKSQWAKKAECWY